MTFSRKWFRLFLEHLALLLGAGVPLLKAVQISRDLRQENRWREFVQRVEGGITGGQSFSDALARTKAGISKSFLATFRLAEETGNLELACQRIASHMEAREQRVSELRRMLIYPLFVVGVAVASLWMLAHLVLPTFESLYQELGIRLPTWARFLFSVIRWGPWVVLFSVLMGTAVVWVWLRKDVRRGEYLLMRIPFFSTFLKRRASKEFLEHLHLLLSSGLSLQSALRVVPRECPRAVKPVLYRIRKTVLAGSPFSESVGKEKLFPSWAIEVLGVGEETGDMTTACQKILLSLEQQDQHRTRMAMSLAEPVLILGTGLGVGLIVLVVIGPLFELLTVTAW